MESAEPTRVEKLTKREEVDLDIANKMHSLRDDAGSKPFGFSHGYLILGSRSKTIVGNFLFYVLSFGIIFAILFRIREPRQRERLAFFWPSIFSECG